MQVFLTHLHSDHIADLATFYAGAMFGRTEPWEVWGPSSEQPQLGLNASIAGLRQVCSISGNISGLTGCHVYLLLHDLCQRCMHPRVSFMRLRYGLLLGADTVQTKAECTSKCTQCICRMCSQVEYALACTWQLAACRIGFEQMSWPKQSLQQWC